MVQLDKDAQLVGRNVGRGNPSPMFSLLGADLAWTVEAECARRCSNDLPQSQRMHPDTWFVSEFEADLMHDAISVCEECPVAIPCLRYAMKEGLVGIWGGTTTDMRRSRSRKIRRKIKKILGEDIEPLIPMEYPCGD